MKNQDYEPFLVGNPGIPTKKPYICHDCILGPGATPKRLVAGASPGAMSLAANITLLGPKNLRQTCLLSDVEAGNQKKTWVFWDQKWRVFTVDGILGGVCNSNIFFHPELWGDDPI